MMMMSRAYPLLLLTVLTEEQFKKTTIELYNSNELYWHENTYVYIAKASVKILVRRPKGESSDLLQSLWDKSSPPGQNDKYNTKKPV